MISTLASKVEVPALSRSSGRCNELMYPQRSSTATLGTIVTNAQAVDLLLHCSPVSSSRSTWVIRLQEIRKKSKPMVAGVAQLNSAHMCLLSYLCIQSLWCTCRRTKRSHRQPIAHRVSRGLLRAPVIYRLRTLSTIRLGIQL